MTKKNVFASWPVTDMLDFEFVCVDATLWQDGTYTAQIVCVEDEERSDPGGLIILTQLGGSNLREIYNKINLLIEADLFAGTNVSGHGTLMDEHGDELGDICWQQFSDTDFDEAEYHRHQVHTSSPALH
jgi:hypothetical protein